eukprot:1195154-Prorocentrum_minimum.AAC.3
MRGGRHTNVAAPGGVVGGLHEEEVPFAATLGLHDAPVQCPHHRQVTFYGAEQMHPRVDGPVLVVPV